MNSPPQMDTIFQLIDSLDVNMSSICARAIQGASAGIPQDASNFAMQESIERKILSLLHKVRLWRNTDIAINRLPAEVLAHIFSFCRTSRHDDMNSPDLSMMRIGSVCQHWRKVALEFPILWMVIDTAHVRSAWIALERSGVVPLRVSLRQPWKENSDTKCPITSSMCRILSDHSYRIHELHIQTDGIDSKDPGSALQCLNRPAPRLHSLLLSAHGGAGAFGRGKLPVMFAGQYPKLRRLFLEGITHWSGRPFVNLTHLSLHNTSFDISFTRQLYDVFSASPKLRELFLTSKVPRHHMRNHLHSVQAVLTAPIRLLDLRTLYLSGDNMSQLLPLVSCLAVSPGVEIYVDGTSFGLDDPKELARLFSKNLGGLDGFPKLRVEVSGSFIKLCGVSGPTAFSFVLKWRTSRPSPVPFLEYVLVESRAASIRELHLKHFDTVALYDLNWSSIFRRMSSLEELVVIGENYVPDEILAGLLPYGSPGEVEVPCTDLSILQVLCLPATGGPIPSLAKVIKARRVNYCSIQTLRLSQAYVGISQEETAQIQNNFVTLEIVADPKHISDTEFEEVVNMQYHNIAPKSRW